MARFQESKIRVIENISIASGAAALAVPIALKFTHNLQGPTVEKIAFVVGLAGGVAAEGGLASRMTDIFNLHRT